MHSQRDRDSESAVCGNSNGKFADAKRNANHSDATMKRFMHLTSLCKRDSHLTILSRKLLGISLANRIPHPRPPHGARVHSVHFSK